ncbi:hypothetical protein OBBRIDRAFT_236150 [Obba rivulosa]|uniref:Uncharacterized protein n=1 Tax=Obba rivulosa TaxID=1052685 RepID=A0A8E2J714_9APHY|nr:hypothetical protein OBBRIDRAFT_236150 [Obba rivulosa]
MLGLPNIAAGRPRTSEPCSSHSRPGVLQQTWVPRKSCGRTPLGHLDAATAPMHPLTRQDKTDKAGGIRPRCRHGELSLSASHCPRTSWVISPSPRRNGLLAPARCDPDRATSHCGYRRRSRSHHTTH